MGNKIPGGGKGRLVKKLVCPHRAFSYQGRKQPCPKGEGYVGKQFFPVNMCFHKITMSFLKKKEGPGPLPCNYYMENRG